MSSPAALHPGLDRLGLFGTGQLSGDEAAGIEAHVSDCPECCEALRGVKDDSFVALVRRASSAPPAWPSGDTTPQFGSRLLPECRADSTFPGARAAATVAEEVPEELREHPRYRVLELLGRGGMGAVYKAEHRLVQSTVALKLIARALTTRPGMAERFVREIRTAGRLAHANIARAFDAEQAGDTLFLVMEFVPGTDLARLVRERGRLPCAEACRYARQAALALQHAHERGIVHRDVKPHNLMLTPDGEIKVLDFGLARIVLEQPLAATSQLTGEGLFLGTADYVAPEQARDARHADIRADVYSLGCTLYHLLAGRVPFPEGTVMDKVVKHATEPPPPLSALRPDLPAGLEAVVMKMMAKQPGQRYRTPGEVAEALAPFAAAAVTPAAPLAQPVRSVRTGTVVEAGLFREPAGALSQTAILPARPAGAGRSGRGRGRRLVAMAAGFLFVAAALAGVVVYRIQTDKGELVITTESDDVEVVVKQGGKVVRIIDTKTKKSLTLSSGVYEFELKGKPTGLRLVPDKATLQRGKTVLAKIERVPPPPPGSAKPGQVEAKEIFRKRWEADRGLGIPWEVRLSPDGRLLLSSHWGGVRIWDVKTGKVLHEKRDGSVGVFTQDGKQFIVRGVDALRLYDSRSGKFIRKFGPPDDRGDNVVICPDGRTVYTRGTLWDYTTGQEVMPQKGGDTEWGMQFGGDKAISQFFKRTGIIPDYVLPGGREVMGRKLVEGNALGIYDLSSGKLVRKVPVGWPGPITQYYSAAAYGLRFGNRMAVSLAGGAIYVVDLISGKEIARFREEHFSPKRLAISADGRFVAACAANEDSDVVVWRLPDPPGARDKR